MATIAELQAAVAAERTVTESAVVLLTELSTLLKDAVATGDPAAIAAVITDLDANRQKLADAVTTNTPVKPGG